MVLTIAPEGASVTQEDASLARASACAFSLRGSATALSRLRVGRPMMALYADGSLTTINDTSRVFDLGYPSNVTEIVVAPKGETESPVNLVKVDVRR
ncbi:hypothetical protein B296_00055280, partial [Ensete ventricosum]